MDRKYDNSPILEAVCEFRLAPETEWDPTIPGLIYEQIKDMFPLKEQRVAREIMFIGSDDRLQQQVRSDERAVFLVDDKKSFVQVGNRLLAVNCLAPYPTWTEFRPKIEKAFKALQDTVELKGLQRIGVRYVNRIEIPEETVDLDTYFNFNPRLGEGLPQGIADFSLDCVLTFCGKRDACKVVLTNRIPMPAPTISVLILDLDYFLVDPEAVPESNGMRWVEEAHGNVEQVFEGCITERLRDLFRERK